jgi:MFS family permease
MTPPEARGLIAAPTPLSPAQSRGFWAAWAGWTLDGMDSFIFALVLAPALTELLPRSGLDGSPARVAAAASVLFAVFLLGWGSSMIWGPIADRWGRTRTLAAAVIVYAVFTAAAAFAHDVWQLGVFRFLAGVGIGGEWALAGTYVAEAWPEDRRRMGAGYLQTGYYAGFFLAAALNYTVGAAFGWRAMFLCGGAPVLLALYMLARVEEPVRWLRSVSGPTPGRPLQRLFGGVYRTRTLVNSGLVTVSIIGLWAGTVYEPTAIMTLARAAGRSAAQSVKLASFGTAVLSMATCLGCLALPPLAERFGRRHTLGLYFGGMGLSIWLSFGWAFHVPGGLPLFITTLCALGFFGGHFAMYSLWLPEQYPTVIRATAFAFVTSCGRFIGAGVNFLIGAGVQHYGSVGWPVAMTALAFLAGLLLLPWSLETRGAALPE